MRYIAREAVGGDCRHQPGLAPPITPLRLSAAGYRQEEDNCQLIAQNTHSSSKMPSHRPKRQIRYQRREIGIGTAGSTLGLGARETGLGDTQWSDVTHVFLDCSFGVP